MKTTMKQLTATTIIALLLMVVNVKAEGIEYNSLNTISIENALELESWMTNETNWNSNFLTFVDFETETEMALELESWMTNTETWNSNFLTEVEAGLELENWMVTEETWNADDRMVEGKLTLESWMVNNNYWK